MPRLVFALLLLSSTALANSIITIGTLTYLGPNSQGLSQYQIELNTNGVTAEPFTNIEYGIGNNLGAVCCIGIPTTAGPITFTITGGGFNNCLPCTSIYFILVIGNGPPVTFQLADGKLFTASSIDISTLLPLSGQSLILPGQSVPINLTSASVPEPGTALLIASGLAGLVARRRRSGAGKSGFVIRS